MNLQIDWTKGLPPERKEDFEKTLRNNTLIFARLNEILRDWEQSINAEEVTTEQYKSPSWAYAQAHRNGQRQTLKKLKDLISFAL